MRIQSSVRRPICERDLTNLGRCPTHQARSMHSSRKPFPVSQMLVPPDHRPKPAASGNQRGGAINHFRGWKSEQVSQDSGALSPGSAPDGIQAAWVCQACHHSTTILLHLRSPYQSGTKYWAVESLDRRCYLKLLESLEACGVIS